MSYVSSIVDLVKVTDGDAGEFFTIETNQEELLKFVDKQNNLTFSPSLLSFSVYKEKNKEKVQIENYDYHIKISSNGISTVLKYYDFFKKNEGDAIIKAGGTTSIDILDTLEQLKDIDETKEDPMDDDRTKENRILKNFFKNHEGFLVIILYKQEGDKQVTLATKPIYMRYGINDDTAKLQINADSINQAIQSTSLKFSAAGLDIYNGGFRISAKDNQGNITGTNFSVDDSGNIAMTGKITATGGIFTGTIQAEDGYFNNGDFGGSINVLGSLRVLGMKTNEAQQQSEDIIIGKLPTEETSTKENLFKEDKKGIYTTNFKNNEVKGEYKGFYLDTSGKVQANQISLANADIKNFIKIGNNTIIQNPQIDFLQRIISITDGNENSLFALNESGQVYLGGNKNLDSNEGIILDGKTRKIHTINYNQQNGWLISEEEAIFNNAIIRGTIKSSVLSYGETQVIGGTTVIRPSFLIEKTFYRKVENKEYYIIQTKDEQTGIKTGDYCKVGNNSGVYQIIYIEKNTTGDFANNYYLTSLGPESSILESNSTLPFSSFVEVDTFNRQLLLSLLSSKTENKKEIFSNNVGIALSSLENDPTYSSQSISIFTNQINKSRTGIERIDHIRLGKMTSQDKINYGLEGYGLYADSVFLKGQLISESPKEGIGPKFYSGINTNSDIIMPNKDKYNNNLFPQANIGNILLWAGAKSSQEEDIKQAPFKVDSYGNLYANSGYFEGTIITNAEITASKLKTAIIEGWNIEKNEGASLTIQNTDRAISFKDTKNSLKMQLNNDSLKLVLPLEIYDNSNFLAISFSQEGIIKAKKQLFGNAFKNISIDDQQIQLSNKSTNHDFSIKMNDSSLVFEQSGSPFITLNSDKVVFNNIISLGKAEFKKISDLGYDLYIYE